MAITAGVAVGAYMVFTVEPTAFGLVAPLLPLPALGVADRIYDRGKAIVDEQAD